MLDPEIGIIVEPKFRSRHIPDWYYCRLCSFCSRLPPIGIILYIKNRQEGRKGRKR